MGETTLQEKLQEIVFKIKQQKENKEREITKLTNEIGILTPMLWKIEGILEEEKQITSPKHPGGTN